MRPIDADELIKNIPNEEMISKYAVAHAPTIDKFEIAKEALIEAIDNAETAGDFVENIIDRPQKWIPCSERLPEKNGEYLITLGFVWGREIEIGFYEDGEWLNDNRHVNIAWMPLPEPWKGADDV